MLAFVNAVLTPVGRAGVRHYIVAVLAAVLTVLVRFALEPILGPDHPFVVPLLGVVFVAWHGGFGPAVLTLALSMLGVVYLFVDPVHTFAVEKPADQLAVAIFLFVGLVCAMLGEAQRRRAEEARRQAQLLDLSFEPILTWEPGGRITSWNAGAERLYGFTADAAIGAVSHDLLQTAHPVPLADVLRSMSETGQWTGEIQHTTKDGRRLTVESRQQLVVLAGRRVVLEVNHDITDRKLAEEQLRESEARFRTLTEAIPQMVWNADAVGRITYVNTRWREYAGLSEEAGLDEWWAEVIHPDDEPDLEASWKELVAGTTASFTHEVRVRRYDGVYRWHLTAVVPIRQLDGTVDQWIGSLSDIHEQKTEAVRLEQMVTDRTAVLRIQEQFLDTVLENVADGIVACNADGRLTLFNAATRRLHGLPSEPITHDRWAERYDLYEPDAVTPLPDDRIPLVRALHGEVVRDAELVVRPDGQPPRYVLANGQRLTDRDGRPLGAVVSMRDVTEQRAAELAREAFAKELQRSNLELEQFAYVASHDLQEPLRKIQAFGDRLRTKHREKFDDQGRDYLDRMLAAAGRMRTLITDLLTLSRVTTAGQPFARVNLSEVVAGVVSDLDHRLGPTDGRVIVGVLPVIQADPVQMRQLFQNLIANALKFRRPGVPPEVRVSAAVESGICRITVADNGIGFGDEYREKIFEVFQRLHGRDQYEGTGIGLAICRKIVERHGGAISAQGRPGEGATFVVTLPVQGLPT